MKKERYFIVCYTYGIKGGLGFGHVEYISSSAYLNKMQIIKDISNLRDGATVVVTNIIELSKRDYKDWTREEDKDEDKNRKEDNGL